MTTRLDWSVGQRLAAGFALVVVVMLAAGAAVVHWQGASAAAQREAVERVLPLSYYANKLERDTIYVGIGVRAYMLEPVDGRRSRAREYVETMLSTMRSLGDLPMQPDDARLHAEIVRAVRGYAALAGQLIEKAPKSEMSAIERELSAGREAALAQVRAFSGLQDRRRAEALDQMTAARDKVSSSLFAAGMIQLGLLLVIGVLVSRSVSRPARRLASVAGSLREGDWKPALALAPPPGAPEDAPAPRDELARIGLAFGAAARALEHREAELQRLLAEVRESNERVQAQNEELQAQNEEIQSQSEELQAQGEELHAQNEELQVQRLEIERTNRELREHAARLAEADVRKNEFLALLAHELRNPLAAISNGVFLLGYPERAPQAREVIKRQMGHLTRLIDDLLDITRISRGKLRLQPESLDFAQLARECIEDCRPNIDAAGLELHVDLPELPVRLHGDRTRIAQVISNLLANSIKFTDRGGRIDVSLRTRARENVAELEVADTGLGMDRELLERLFVPFSQGDHEAARNGGGLGLGLALARALLELHGGSIEAFSEGPAAGARFVVTLPLDEPGGRHARSTPSGRSMVGE